MEDPALLVEEHGTVLARGPGVLDHGTALDSNGGAALGNNPGAVLDSNAKVALYPGEAFGLMTA
jgi:hypothetical protein